MSRALFKYPGPVFLRKFQTEPARLHLSRKPLDLTTSNQPPIPARSVEAYACTLETIKEGRNSSTHELYLVFCTCEESSRRKNATKADFRGSMITNLHSDVKNGRSCSRTSASKCFFQLDNIDISLLPHLVRPADESLRSPSPRSPSDRI